MKYSAGNIKKNFFIFFLVIIFSCNAYCQLSISTAMTPAQLVQNILVSGGVNISNVTFSGNTGSTTSQFGSFTNASTTYLGLSSGIVMSTGYVPHIAAQGNAGGSMSDLPLTGSDADLASLAGIALNKTYDKCILEFDFVPTGNTVAFTYVFGSEEEPNWVCSQYDDVFGFFLSGPGIAGPFSNGAVNIALIPGTSYPVSVNTVNNGSIGSSTSGNNCPSYGLNYSMYYVNNLPDPYVVFGGLTTVLTATYSVTPCGTYHIKLAICDTGNGNFDSGVFLGANSFSANTFAVNTHYTNTALGNNAVEGCSQGLFSFILPAAATSPNTINYTISGTAGNGTDYTSIPASITIPAGQDSAGVYINPFFDGITEGNETVIITYTNGCVVQSDTIIIKDNIPLTIATSNDTTICMGSSASLISSATGGILPYTYAWNNGSSTNNTSVNPVTNTTYTLSVSDNCGQSATGNILVNVNSVNATVASTNEFCNQANGSVTATGTGTCNSTFAYQWNTASSTPIVSNLPAGNYTVTVSCGACSASASTIVANISGPAIVVDSVITCDCGQMNGAIFITINGGTQPYSFNWNSTPAQTTEDIQDIPAGNFLVTVTDINGCTATSAVTVGLAGGPVLAVSSTNEMCRHSDGTATVIATGGTGTYTYLWSTNPPQATATATGLTSGTYTVTVDDGNCSTTASIAVNGTAGPTADININPPVTTLMNGPVVISGSSNGTIVNWSWDYGDGTVGTGQSNTHQYGSLGTFVVTLLITDNSGCVDSVIDSVKVKDISTLYIPNSFTPNGDGHNDLFLPYGLNVDPDTYEMMIFDRWGQMLFDTKEWGVGWNGTLNNHGTKDDVVLDVYVYKIKAKPIDGGKLREYYGRVFLFP